MDTESGKADFSADGRRVLTVSDNKTRVWDALTGLPISQPLAHESKIEVAELTKFGNDVVTRCGDEIRVWNIVADPVEYGISPVSQSRNGSNILIYTHSYNQVQVFDGVTQQPVGLPMVHAKDVVDAEFSPDGSVVLTFSDHRIRLWNAKTGRPIGQAMRGGQSTLATDSFSLSRDGRRLLTLSNDSDRYFQLWDVQTGIALGQRIPQGIHIPVFSANGRRILSFLSPGWLALRDADTGEVIGHPIFDSQTLQWFNSRWSADFSPDSSHIVSFTADRKVQLWNANTGEPIGQPIGDQAYDVIFSPNSSSRVVLRMGNLAQLWDVDSAKPVGKPMGELDSLVFSPDGSRLLAFSNRVVTVFDAETGKEIEKNTVSANTDFKKAVFSPDGSRFMVIGEHGSHLCKTETGEVLNDASFQSLKVGTLTFSPDASQFVTATSSRSILSWDSDTGRPNQSFASDVREFRGDVGSLSFIDSSQTLAVRFDGTDKRRSEAQLWDTRTGKPISLPNLIIFDSNQPTDLSLVGIKVADTFADIFNVWSIRTDIVNGNPDAAQQLAELAESISGLQVSDNGSFRPAQDAPQRLAEVRVFAAHKAVGVDPLADFIRRILDVKK